MSSNLKKKTASPVEHENTFIIKKLKTTGSSWPYLIPKNEVSILCYGNYFLHQKFIDKKEMALYKLDGEYFVLVDFFTEINLACVEARKALENHRER